MRKANHRESSLVAGSAVAALLLILTGALIYQLRASAESSDASAAMTLDPNQFDGKIRQAYQVAREHPDVLVQLHCYCGCEQHEGHRNLLDCFRTTHAADCATCVGEAVLAGQMIENGTPVEQILAALHQRYANGS
jgi:hypothetical protein